MFRVRNGQRIELTPEEEAEIQEEWGVNREAHQREEQEKFAKQAARQSALDKIAQTCSLTSEEMQSLFES